METQPNLSPRRHEQQQQQEVTIPSPSTNDSIKNIEINVIKTLRTETQDVYDSPATDDDQEEGNKLPDPAMIYEQSAPLQQTQELPLTRNLQREPQQNLMKQTASKKDFTWLTQSLQAHPSTKSLPKKTTRLAPQTVKISKSKKRRFKSPPNHFHSSIGVNPRCVTVQDTPQPKAEVEDVSHSLWRLKIEHNKIKDENYKYKTRNSQLETLINTLYEDLHGQQDEIEKIYQGKSSAKIEFLQQSLALGLKRQLREERTINKMLTDDIEQLKRTARMTSIDELNVEIMMLQDEAVRLRVKLKKEIQAGNKNMMGLTATHFNLLQSIGNEEDRRSVASQFTIKDNHLKAVQKEIAGLKSDHEFQLLKQARTDAQKIKHQTDLTTKQAFLIGAKGEQIKMMTDQITSQTQKTANADRILQRNQELLMQTSDQQASIGSLEKQVKELQEKLAQPLKLQLSPEARREVIKGRSRSPLKKGFQTQKFHKSKFEEKEQLVSDASDEQPAPESMTQKFAHKKYANDLIHVGTSPKMLFQRQMLRPNGLLTPQTPQLEIQPIIEETIQDSSLKRLSEAGSGRLSVSAIPSQSTQYVHKKTHLSKTELLCRGLKNFKALIQNLEQPTGEKEKHFLKWYSKEIQQFYNLLMIQEMPSDIVSKAWKDKVSLDPALSLSDQVRVLMSQWSNFALELQVCKLVVTYVIPSISSHDTLNEKQMYNMMLGQLAELSSNILSKDLQNSKIDSKRSTKKPSSPLRTSPLTSENTQIGASVSALQISEMPILVKDLHTSVIPMYIDEDMARTNEAQALLSMMQSVHPKVFDAPAMESLRALEQHQTPADYKSQLQAMVGSNLPLKVQTGLSIKQFKLQDQSSNEVSPAIQMFSAENTAERPEPTQTQYSSDDRADSVQLYDDLLLANQTITEDTMLDTAEQILHALAQKLIQNGWSVQDVFGQPEEIIKIIPEHDGDRMIKVLTPQNFIGRVNQIGIANLTQLQLACLMRVLGKPEFDDAVRYNELELLMENFGVAKYSEQTSSLTVAQNYSYSRPTTVQDDETGILPQRSQTLISQSNMMSEGVLFIDDTRPQCDLVQIEQQTSNPSSNGDQFNARYEEEKVQASTEVSAYLRSLPPPFEVNPALFRSQVGILPAPSGKSLIQQTMDKTAFQRQSNNSKPTQQQQSSQMDKTEGSQAQPSMLLVQETSRSTTSLNPQPIVRANSNMLSQLQNNKKQKPVSKHSCNTHSDNNQIILVQRALKKQYTRELHQTSTESIPKQRPSIDSTLTKNTFSREIPSSNFHRPARMMAPLGTSLESISQEQAQSSHKGSQKGSPKVPPLLTPLPPANIMFAIESNIKQNMSRQTAIQNAELQPSIISEGSHSYSSQSISPLQQSVMQRVVESSIKNPYSPQEYAVQPNITVEKPPVYRQSISESPQKLINKLPQVEGTEDLKRFQTIGAELLAPVMKQPENPLLMSPLQFAKQSSFMMSEDSGVPPGLIKKQFGSLVNDANRFVKAGASSQSLGAYFGSLKEELAEKETESVAETYNKYSTAKFSNDQLLVQIQQSSQNGPQSASHKASTVEPSPQPDEGLPLRLDSRLNLRHSIVSSLRSPIRMLLVEVLKQVKYSDLMVMLEKNGYKQHVKSSTKAAETHIIPQASFVSLMYGYTNLRLSERDIDELAECVQLSPKVNYLFTIRNLGQLIGEVQLQEDEMI